MTQHPENFGDLLKQEAGRRNLSLTDLAKRSGVHLTNVSKIASGKRACGLSMAVRMADALWLAGPERMHFLQAAASTSKRTATLFGHSHLNYPSEIMLVGANFLNASGITPDQIDRIAGSCRDGLVLVLGNGAQLELRLTLTPKRA